MGQGSISYYGSSTPRPYKKPRTWDIHLPGAQETETMTGDLIKCEGLNGKLEKLEVVNVYVKAKFDVMVVCETRSKSNSVGEWNMLKCIKRVR